MSRLADKALARLRMAYGLSVDADDRVAARVLTIGVSDAIKILEASEAAPDEDVRELLARCVKYAHEDCMVTPRFTRLARVLAEAEKLLAANPKTSARRVDP